LRWDRKSDSFKKAWILFLGQNRAKKDHIGKREEGHLQNSIIIAMEINIFEVSKQGNFEGTASVGPD